MPPSSRACAVHCDPRALGPQVGARVAHAPGGGVARRGAQRPAAEHLVADAVALAPDVHVGAALVDRVERRACAAARPPARSPRPRRRAPTAPDQRRCHPSDPSPHCVLLDVGELSAATVGRRTRPAASADRPNVRSPDRAMRVRGARVTFAAMTASAGTVLAPGPRAQRRRCSRSGSEWPASSRCGSGGCPTSRAPSSSPPSRSRSWPPRWPSAGRRRWARSAPRRRSTSPGASTRSRRARSCRWSCSSSSSSASRRGASSRRRRSAGALGLAAVWLTFVLTDNDFANYMFTGRLRGRRWLAGRGIRSRQARADDFEAHVVRVEREREAKAREAVADERARIARELHDVVSHSVGVIVIQAQAAQQLEVGEEAVAAVAARDRVQRPAGARGDAAAARAPAPRGRGARARARSRACATSTTWPRPCARRGCRSTCASRATSPRCRPASTCPPTGSCRRR